MIGLDKKDNEILDLIWKKPLHTSELARQLGIKRTTLTYRLQRFVKSGFVESTTSGRKSLYSPKFNKTGAKNHFQIFKGREIASAYREFFDLPKNSIILSVQGSGAANAEMRNLPRSFITEAHRVFKKKGIILKGFSNEKAFKAFEKIEKPLIKSHIGRSLGIKVFNNNLFTCKGEIMVASKLLLLGNPEAKKVILIKDKEIVQVVYDVLTLLFELLEDTSTFDLNSYLKKTYF